MSFDEHMAKLAQKYIQDVKQKEVTIQELMRIPHWQRVWYYWKALEKYEGKPIPMSKDDCKTIYGRE